LGIEVNIITRTLGMLDPECEGLILKDKNSIRQTHTINDVFDVYCFYLLTFKLLTHRDDFNQKLRGLHM